MTALHLKYCSNIIANDTRCSTRLPCKRRAKRCFVLFIYDWIRFTFNDSLCLRVCVRAMLLLCSCCVVLCIDYRMWIHIQKYIHMELAVNAMTMYYCDEVAMKSMWSFWIPNTSEPVEDHLFVHDIHNVFFNNLFWPHSLLSLIYYRGSRFRNAFCCFNQANGWFENTLAKNDTANCFTVFIKWME